jgi:hypothetical protein
MEIVNYINIELEYPFIDDYDSTYIADISGIDSIAALVTVMRQNDHSIIIPTIVDVACEYGEKWDEFTRIYKDICAAFNVYHRRVLPAIILDVNELWHRIVSNSMQAVVRNVQFYSPCIGCHLAFHLARIRLAQHLNVKGVISGEREFHGQKEKINQLDFVLDFFNSIYGSASINHLQPVRKVRSSEDLKQLVAGYDISPVKVKCLFSGNYYKLNKIELDVEKENIRHYVDYLEDLLQKPQEDLHVNCRILDP